MIQRLLKNTDRHQNLAASSVDNADSAKKIFFQFVYILEAFKYNQT